MIKNTEKQKARLKDVLLAYWEAIKPQKVAMYFTLCAFTLNSILMLIVPLFYKKFFDLLVSLTNKTLLYPELLKLLLIILLIHFVGWVLLRGAFFVLNDFESSTMARLRQISFDYMIKHSYSFFTHNFAGALVQRVGRFSRSFERLYDTLVFNIIPLLIHVVGVLIIVWLEKPIISYIIFVWILAIFIISFLFSRWKVKYDVESAKADSTTTAVLADNISNQNTVILFNNFDFESKSFKGTTNDQAKIQRFTWNLGNIFDGTQGLLIVIVEFLIFYYAVKYWQVGSITIGTFVLLQAYVLGLSHRLWDLGKIIRNLYEAFADSKEMVDILITPHEIKDLPGAKDLEVKNGEIVFEEVCFNFNETRSVLDKFELKIKGGEKIALIGPSGAGKSTIVKLLLRMHDLTSGRITIDGQDIKRITQQSLRKSISLVPQDPVLFHRTLFENICYGKPTATKEEVFHVAKLAHCAEFIDELPLKYDTLVGERGVRLSGGERQRIAIARAILKNSPILILDEATSSLDSHSESLIQDALDKLMEGKTSIVIAHRLSTIRKMDRIVVIKDGNVHEEGSHADLLAKRGGLYKKLWKLQAGGFIKDS